MTCRLLDHLRALQGIQENQPELLGASVFGANEIYTRLKAFKSQLVKDGDSKALYAIHKEVEPCPLIENAMLVLNSTS